MPPDPLTLYAFLPEFYNCKQQVREKKAADPKI